MQEICDRIPDEFGELDGYHRERYQRFTMNLSRLKPGAHSSNPEDRRSSRKKCTGDNILFEPTCIFCQQFGRKKAKKGNAWTTEGLSSLEHGGGPTIVKPAEERKDEDLARQIRGKDLFGCEAKYHKACRMKYCDRGKWRSPDPLRKEQAQYIDETHSNCFNKLCKVIDKNIVLNKEIVKMTDLRDLHVEYLSETPFSNPNYETQKLKCRLMNDDVYGTKIAFIGLGRSGGKLQTDLEFSTETTSLAEAVRSGYLFGCSDKIDDAGILLRNIIKDTFEEADELPWPPTASYLQPVENSVPIELQRFLSTLISGHGSALGSEKLETFFFPWARSLPCCNEWSVEVAEAHYGMHDTTTPIQKCPAEHINE
ncbi:MAG: hypothetical protein ACK5JN_18195 [Kluyvera sp.]|uniref:hypothetical protein n=1 Tax=Kluyvera sp. TaxID=1538228 RepID=UPI003A846C28